MWPFMQNRLNENMSALKSQKGAVGTERFDGFRLLTRTEAAKVLRSGRDEHGNYYSVYTWVCLAWFVSGLWEETDCA